MIKSDKGNLVMLGPEFVLGAELLDIFRGVVGAYEEQSIDICKYTFDCARDIGEVDTLIKIAELMKNALN